MHCKSTQIIILSFPHKNSSDLFNTHRLLEKGGLFAFYEWLMTDKYNLNDEGHKKIKEGIMVSTRQLKSLDKHFT